jgi:hypothetical protein
MLRRDATKADKVIFVLCRLVGQDFAELVLLAQNGHGEGAQKILRTLYERAVTARYLHEHETDADRFLRYGAIQVGKWSRRILQLSEKRPGLVEAKWVENCKARIKEMKAVEDEFLAPACSKCKKCGRCATCQDCKACNACKRKVSHTWGLDLVSMALKCKGLDDLIAPCYLTPTLYTHPSEFGLRQHTKQIDGEWVLDFGPRRDKATDALRNAHMVILDTFEVMSERFPIDGYPAVIAAVHQAFKEIWHDEPPPRSE